MGFFNKKTAVTQPSAKDNSFRIAQNVFGKSLTSDEVINFALSGKCAAKNLIFSVGVFGATEKRLLYYFQNGSTTNTETILYDKIISVSSSSGFEAKMGSYIGLDVELANGAKRVVRCLADDEHRALINDITFYIESKR